MPHNERTPALVGVRGSGFVSAASVDSSETTIPHPFKSIGSETEAIVQRLARRLDLPLPTTRMIVQVAELGVAAE